jgi:glycosyltransferase
MKISVVTAVYNRQSTIGDTLASVAAQTHPDVEHLIQDGGSTDGTLECIRAHATPNTALVSAPDAGIYDAINRGIERATGDVIGLLHSDDRFASPEVLREVAARFEDPEVSGVYVDLQYVSAADPSRVVRYWRAGPYAPEHLTRGWMPPHPTLYLRREVLEQGGLYDTGFQIAADYDAMLRWLASGIRLAYLPQVMINMRLGGESNRSLARILRKSREDYAAIRRNGVGGLGTLLMKNARKLPQFFRRDRI